MFQGRRKLEHIDSAEEKTHERDRQTERQRQRERIGFWTLQVLELARVRICLGA